MGTPHSPLALRCLDPQMTQMGRSALTRNAFARPCTALRHTRCTAPCTVLHAAHRAAGVYGTKELVNQYSAALVATDLAYESADPRVGTFNKFLLEEWDTRALSIYLEGESRGGGGCNGRVHVVHYMRVCEHVCSGGVEHAQALSISWKVWGQGGCGGGGGLRGRVCVRVVCQRVCGVGRARTPSISSAR